ncbi:MAG TPA: ABC transporter ATP-binding protein [Candidatus Acidoferrales bacterium]|nr:ABC transporter ATP-binding protein [Candidatus Acidoferrales bacterium]
MLELNSLSKKFGSFTAVENLSLNIEPGEIYGFLGPNGAGKTTTIKVIATLLKPTSGIVRINDIDAHKFPREAKKYLSYVPDQPFLYEKLSGQEFLLFVARLYGMEKEDAMKSVKGVSEIFEVLPWLNKRIEDYSQGMRQRLILAAAMMHRPKLIVIDEPMVGLDPRGAETFKAQTRLAAQNGAAVFVTTHQLSLAKDICTRVGIIHKGRLVFEGSMQEFSGNGTEHLEKRYIELTS